MIKRISTWLTFCKERDIEILITLVSIPCHVYVYESYGNALLLTSELQYIINDTILFVLSLLVVFVVVVLVAVVLVLVIVVVVVFLVTILCIIFVFVLPIVSFSFSSIVHIVFIF